MINKFDFTKDEWEVNKCGNLYEVREKFHGGSGLLLTINNYTKNKGGKKLANFISCAPEMLNALIENTKSFKYVLDLKKSLLDLNLKLEPFEGEKKAENKCLEIDIDFYLKIVENNINIIEKATGKKWEDICKS